MGKLIDIDDLKLPPHFFERIDNVPKFYEWLEKQPPADAVHVRHGKWEPAKAGDDFFWKCSYCGFPSEAAGAKDLYKYCPVCGAKMD